MRLPAAGSRIRNPLHAGAALLLIVLLAGCLLPPEPKTEAAEDVFGLYLVILGLAALVFVGVEGFILYAVVRYRRRPGDDDLPPQLHGNTLVEVIWTVIPSVIVLILFVASMIALGAVEARSERPGVTIEVHGFQWQWTFRYAEGVSVTGSAGNPPVMAVPVGEAVRLRLIGDDVIHSFYVPQFLIKRDVVPVAEGKAPNEMEFTVTQAGTYTGQCAEFCGTGHADMNFAIEAMSRADYEAWIGEQLAGATPQPSAGACATTVEITAVEIAFNTDTLEVPANQEFCIQLTNEDSLPHDVGILGAGGEPLFNGEDVTGPATFTYQVPALPPGEYKFLCTIHPADMTGILTASE